jgi:hypothetical protein
LGSTFFFKEKKGNQIELINMNVNKKFDRFKQWAGEKMGGEAKTNTSEQFKALEMEMNLRHEGW